MSNNFNTEKVNMTDGGYALFIGGESIIIGGVKFKGTNGKDCDNEGSVDWVMKSLGEMVSDAHNKIIPENSNDKVNFSGHYIGEERSLMQIELEDKLEEAAINLAKYLKNKKSIKY
ncbi:coil containing protein [Vibrio phage vB_VcM_SY]